MKYIQSYKKIGKFFIKISLLTIFLLTTMTQIMAQSDERFQFQTREQRQQFVTLTETLRCVVCQNQSLADSDAPLALDLKNKIRNMILAQQSNVEIESYLAQRYGDFILLNPRFSFKTAALWLLPFVGLFFLFFFIIIKH